MYMLWVCICVSAYILAWQLRTYPTYVGWGSLICSANCSKLVIEELFSGYKYNIFKIKGFPRHPNANKYGHLFYARFVIRIKNRRLN